MLDVPYEPAAVGLRREGPLRPHRHRDRRCCPRPWCSSWCLPSLHAPRTPSPFRWPAHRWCRWSSPWCHALCCRLPTSLPKVSVNVSPSPSSWTLRPVVIPSTSTRHRGCRCWRAVWACRMSVCAVKVATHQSYRRSVCPPVLKLVSSVRFARIPRHHYVRWQPAHRWCRWSSPDVMLMCRPDVRQRRFPLTSSPTIMQLLNCVQVRYSCVHTPSVPMLNVPYEPAVSGLRREGPLRPHHHHWSSVCRPCSSWCLPSLRPHPRRHPFRDRRIVGAGRSSPWCHALCVCRRHCEGFR